MIRSHFPLSVLFALSLLLTACTDTPPSGNDGSDTTVTEDTTGLETPDDIPNLSPPECQIEGEVLEGNQVWIKSQDVLAVIKADASTTTEGFGPSHRILEILDGRTCASKFQTTLPENSSPDYPYYVAAVQYNNISNIIGIQGYYDIFICDMGQGYKLSKLSPEYFTEREYDDPQTGMVQRLEVWEDYLLGFAQDCGAFAFDLSDRANPKAVIPFAEWKDSETSRFHSLFLLPTEGGVQGIVPFYDAEKDAFMIHPLFDTPQAVSDQVSRSARNNKLLVLRKTDESRTPIAINLGSRSVVNLPADIAGKSTQDILAWMRTQGN